MAVSLAPCPLCRRPMDPARSVCVYCQQSGHQAPPPASEPTQYYQAPAPVKKSSRPALFFLGFLIPIAGFIYGLVRVFDADPDKKAEAGPLFGGAVAGLCFLPVLLGVAWMINATLNAAGQ